MFVSVWIWQCMYVACVAQVSWPVTTTACPAWAWRRTAWPWRPARGTRSCAYGTKRPATASCAPALTPTIHRTRSCIAQIKHGAHRASPPHKHGAILFITLFILYTFVCNRRRMLFYAFVLAVLVPGAECRRRRDPWSARPIRIWTEPRSLLIYCIHRFLKHLNQ